MTVTLNTALDLTYVASHFEWGEQNRVREVHSRAGGKGVNVARILEKLGVRCVVGGLAGGPTGRAIQESLRTEGLEAHLIEIEADSRRTVVAVSETDGIATEFDEPGPLVTAHEWKGFMRDFEELVEGRRAVVLAGSLPRGVREDAYRSLAEVAKRAGVLVVLDTSGPALLAGLGGGPAVVKPNARELTESSGGRPGLSGLLAAAAGFRKRGAEAVVVSMGAEGLLAVTGEGTWRAKPPHVSGNPVGAGDTVVAALLAGLLEGRSWLDLLARAAALSAATVAHPVAGGFDEARYPGLLAETRVEPMTDDWTHRLPG